MHRTFDFRGEDGSTALTASIQHRWHSGALRITTEGGATQDGRAVLCLYLIEPTTLRLDFEGSDTAFIESCLALTDLDINELLAVVAYHDVATNAGTEAGLIRAIERELGL